MKLIYALFIGFLLYCSNKKEDIATNSLSIQPAVKKIHLFRTNGMIDISKPVANRYFSIIPKKILTISKLRNPNGLLIKSDTVKTVNADNNSLLEEAAILMKETYNKELDNDGNQWGVTVFYNGGQKNFIFRDSTNIYPIVGRLGNLLIVLEKRH